MSDVKTGSGLGLVLGLVVVLGLGYEVVTHMPGTQPMRTPEASPLVTVDAAPVPVTVVPAPGKSRQSAKPTPTTTRGVLIYVATWTKDPPTVLYTVAGRTNWAYPQEQGPWQWSSRPAIVPVSGVNYFMQVGSTFGDFGIISCQIEVNGIVVTQGPGRRDTSTDPGAIRCSWTAP